MKTPAAKVRLLQARWEREDGCVRKYILLDAHFCACARAKPPVPIMPILMVILISLIVKKTMYDNAGRQFVRSVIF